MPHMGRQPARASTAGATEAAGGSLRPSERALAPARRRAEAGTDRAPYARRDVPKQRSEKGSLGLLLCFCSRKITLVPSFRPHRSLDDPQDSSPPVYLILARQQGALRVRSLLCSLSEGSPSGCFSATSLRAYTRSRLYGCRARVDRIGACTHHDKSRAPSSAPCPVQPSQRLLRDVRRSDEETVVFR